MTGWQDPHRTQPGHQTGGFPERNHPGHPAPPSRLPMILGVLAIVLIVGAVVTIGLVNQERVGTPTAAPVSAATTPPSTAPGNHDDWQTVDNTADAGLTYRIPLDWKVVTDPRDSGLGVDFTGSAEYGTYECQGANYVRTYVASGDVQAKDGSDLDLAKTVREFTTSFAKVSFRDDALVEIGEPKEFEFDGQPAMTLTATVTPQVTVPACQATDGEVSVLGVALAEDGEPTGVTMLVVVNDVAGGPDDPAPTPPSVTRDILDSATVSQ